MRVVSFDFDDTLLQTLPNEDWGTVEGGPNEPVIAQLRAHAAAGDRVLIVTTRRGDFEDAPVACLPRRTRVVDFVAEHDLPIAVEDIHFTNGSNKWWLLQHLGVTKHFDDDQDELDLLPETIEGVLVPVHAAWGSNPETGP
jgi:hypothetical protein